jgi:hypothetical protein
VIRVLAVAFVLRVRGRRGPGEEAGGEQRAQAAAKFFAAEVFRSVHR